MRIISIIIIISATTLLLSKMHQSSPSIIDSYNYKSLTLINYSDDTCGINDTHGSCDVMNELIHECESINDDDSCSTTLLNYINANKIYVIDNKMMDNYTDYIISRMNL
jgi:hypothetical protein